MGVVTAVVMEVGIETEVAIMIDRHGDVMMEKAAVRRMGL